MRSRLLALCLLSACHSGKAPADAGLPSLATLDGVQAALAVSRDGLGARMVSAERHTVVKKRDATVEDLAETLRLEADGKSGLRVLHDIGGPKGDGMEAFLVGGELFVRPRFQTFVRRKPEQGEVARLRQLVEGVVAADVELLQPGIDAATATTRLGRPCQLVKLKPSSAKRPAEHDATRRWREQVTVESLAGELIFDDATRALVEAKLDAVYHYPIADGVLQQITVHHAETTTAGATIAAPESAVASPERPRPMLDRQTLLEGLVPARSGTQPGGALR
jgi:hypothetical protein